MVTRQRGETRNAKRKLPGKYYKKKIRIHR